MSWSLKELLQQVNSFFQTCTAETDGLLHVSQTLHCVLLSCYKISLWNWKMNCCLTVNFMPSSETPPHPPREQVAAFSRRTRETFPCTLTVCSDPCAQLGEVHVWDSFAVTNTCFRCTRFSLLTVHANAYLVITRRAKGQISNAAGLRQVRSGGFCMAESRDQSCSHPCSLPGRTLPGHGVHAESLLCTQPPPPRPGDSL